jgi:hypothetical protein
VGNKNHTASVTNLIVEVSAALQKRGHARPHDWEAYLDPAVHQTTDLSQQRFFINRAWRQIIGTVKDEPTMDQRYCLIDDGNIDDWLKIFNAGLVSWITQRALPVVKQ